MARLRVTVVAEWEMDDQALMACYQTTDPVEAARMEQEISDSGDGDIFMLLDGARFQSVVIEAVEE